MIHPLFAVIDAILLTIPLFILLHPLLERSHWWTGPRARLYVCALLLGLFSGLYCLAWMAA